MYLATYPRIVRSGVSNLVAAAAVLFLVLLGAGCGRGGTDVPSDGADDLSAPPGTEDTTATGPDGTSRAPETSQQQDTYGVTCAGKQDGEWTTSLDGPWSASARKRTPGADWSEPTDLGEVSVPGWFFPFPRFPSAGEEVELTLSRQVEWPSEWDCAGHADDYRSIVELDSADYRSRVRFSGTELAVHDGYLGRFGVQLPPAVSGELEVVLTDAVYDADAQGGIEAFPHKTLQGVDTGGWGVNPVGLPGDVRLRLVRGVYLRNAYAAAMSRNGDVTRVRIGVDTETVINGFSALGAVRVRIANADGKELVDESEPVVLDDRGETFFDLDVPGLPDVSIGEHGEASVEVRLECGEALCDARTVPLINRRVALESTSLQINGVDHFARGAGIHHNYRFMPFDDGEYAQGTWVSLDDGLEKRYSDRLDETVSAGAQWLRPGHFLPDPVFLRTVRSKGMLAYQDFPLHWNTDFASLTKDEILRQFREFLWRVAAEPAVAIVAGHNEAEFGEGLASDLQLCQEVIDELLKTAKEVAPHLVMVGCSGCKGTAQFPGNPQFPVADVISDAHSYFGSWWQPHTAYLELPERVAEISNTSELPTLWSEMGNGWTRHFGYLAALEDELEPSSPQTLVQLRAELESWLKAPDGTPLTLRQFYALLYCVSDLGTPRQGAKECVQETIEMWSDSQFISWARARWFADRAAVEGYPSDPAHTGALVAAHWLASQIFESRWQWAQKSGFLAVIPWERGENAFPMAPLGPVPVPEAAIDRSREILAAANAQVGLSLRNLDGGIEIRLVNDGPATEVELKAYVDGAQKLSMVQPVPAQGGAEGVVAADKLTGLAGKIIRVEVIRDAANVSEASLVYAP